MRNKEKFHDQIFAIACSGSAVAVLKGEPKACRGINCKECDFHLRGCVKLVKEWCDAECAEQPVDWSKVAIDTKIFVSIFNDEQWRPRHFAGRTKDGEVGAWRDGKTSFSDDEKEICYWPFAKLAEDEC